MSVSCGACGAYGVMLAEREDIKDLYNEFQKEVEAEAADPYDSIDMMMNENPPEELLRQYAEKFVAAFAELGIVIPKTAELFWTGLEDDRPARGGCAAESWVLGFGLFTPPADYPKLDPTFIKESNWHTWVWMA